MAADLPILDILHALGISEPDALSRGISIRITAKSGDSELGSISGKVFGLDAMALDVVVEDNAMLRALTIRRIL
jgi:hypothetical protein